MSKALEGLALGLLGLKICGVYPGDLSPPRYDVGRYLPDAYVLTRSH